MKSTVKTFTYVNAKGEKKVRNVFVMEETNDAIRGYDMDALGTELAANVKTVYADHEVSDTIKMVSRGNANPDRPNKEFDAGWRLFKKASIVKD